MTNTFDTRSLPVGSTDVKVLYNNASNFDDFSVSTSPYFEDRFGVDKLTINGMQDGYQSFLLNSGYQQIGDYAAGLQVTARNQIFRYNGEYWRASAATALPYTMTGTWATDGPKFVSVGDAVLRQALAAANGVKLVTGATPQMQTLAQLQAFQGRYANDQVTLLGNDLAHAGRGDRWYRWDATSTTTADGINVVQVTGVTTGRWLLYGREVIRASDWGMYGDGSDVTQQLAALCAYHAAKGATGTHTVVQFAAGDYKASAWPNMAMRGFIVDCMGEVFWTNTGTGPNLNLDGGALSGMKVDGFYIGSPARPVTLRGGSGAGMGIYARATIGSNCVVCANVFGCGTSKAALRTEWAVLNTFHLNITPGDLTTGSLAWYGGGVPSAGISLSQRLAGEQTSYCWFPNLVTNACGVGIYLDSTLGNNICYGDCEYSSAVGLLTTANALKDKIMGMNFEVNPTDISCQGNGVVFDKCHAVNMVLGAQSVNCKILSCLTDAIIVNAGAVGSHIGDTSFSRGISSTVITDNGTETRHSNNYNMTTNKFQNAPKVVLAPAVTFTSGVYTWTNNTGDTVLVQGTGGTITNVSVGTGDVATIPYPMARIPVMSGEPIAFAGSGSLVFKVWRGI